MSLWSSGTGVLLANLLATCGPELGHELQSRPPPQRLWQWPGARPGERPRQLGKGLGLCQGRVVVEVAGFPSRANIPAEQRQATASRASFGLGEADASASPSDPRLQYRLLQSAKHSQVSSALQVWVPATSCRCLRGERAASVCTRPGLCQPRLCKGGRRARASARLQSPRRTHVPATVLGIDGSIAAF